jgi:hypothetical protein
LTQPTEVEAVNMQPQHSFFDIQIDVPWPVPLASVSTS